jgi:hypothetical protein
LTESSAQAANGAAVRPAPAGAIAAGDPAVAGGTAGPGGADGDGAQLVAPRTAPDAGLAAEPAAGFGTERSTEAEGEAGTDTDADSALDLAGEDSPAGLTKGIWWGAVLLPFLSVAGAVLCFAAGVLNTGGCQPEGSALCSGGGQWFTFVLPLMVAPLTAGVTAIGAVTFHRHRSTWLAVGYAVLFISVLIGLASANSGSA